MLKKLFTSKTRIKLLSVFLLNPQGEFFIRELTRKLDEQINSIRRELSNLKKLGLLKSRAMNRKKFYVVNKNFILFNELRSIILKASSTVDNIIKKVQKIGDVDLLILSGVFVDKNSSADLLIVGTVDQNALQEFLEKEVETKKPLRMSVMSREDFLYRLKCNDKFIKDFIESPDNIIAMNKLEKYL